MQFLHGGNAAFAGALLLPLTPCSPIFMTVAVVEFALAAATSLLDLAERKLGLFFGLAPKYPPRRHYTTSRRRLGKAASASCKSRARNSRRQDAATVLLQHLRPNLIDLGGDRVSDFPCCDPVPCSVVPVSALPTPWRATADRPCSFQRKMAEPNGRCNRSLICSLLGHNGRCRPE